MLAYVTRRVLYAVPILLGVNLLTFLLFFVVNPPDAMARAILGEKGSTPQAIENWKRERGYHLPRLYNREEKGLARITQTIFVQKSVSLLVFDFGYSDKDRDHIGAEMRRRIPASLSFTVPIFLLALFVDVVVAMVVAFYRATYLDGVALFFCVIFMSVSGLFYIIGGQFLFGIWLGLTPISGYGEGLTAAKFLVVPVLVGLAGGFGSGVRFNRTLFLEEIGKDYVRTARAKGLSEPRVLFLHVLKNAMIPILTSVVFTIPFLFTGSLMTEAFFSIPGLGGFTIDAINAQDFAIVRCMVYLGSVLYIVAQILTDTSYTLVDPRVRLG